MDRESKGTVLGRAEMKHQASWCKETHIGDKLHAFLSSELKSGSPETRHGRSWVRSKGSVLLSHPEKVLSEDATQLWPYSEGAGRSLTYS
jgi:hypothetical protein